LPIRVIDPLRIKVGDLLVYFHEESSKVVLKAQSKAVPKGERRVRIETLPRAG